MLTNEEAIMLLEETKAWHLKKVCEALDMAIQALQETNGDGCDGCKYMNKDQYEMPCLVCSKSHKNMYKRGNDSD